MKSRSKRPANATDAVVEAILPKIFDASYLPGIRLPTERDLAESTGTSRISVRPALAKMAGWGLIETRQGSGTVVRPRRDWSFSVLPAYIQYCAGHGQFAELRFAVTDILVLRRVIVVDLACDGHRRFKSGDFDPVREQTKQAWKHRKTVKLFLEHDLEKSRVFMEIAGKLSSLWLLNNIVDAIIEFAALVPSELLVPDDYLEAHLAFLDALEANNLKRARRIALGLFERQDGAILSRLTMGE